MRLKGIEKFSEKIPNLSGKKILLLPLYAICILSLCVLTMIGFDSIPDLAKSGINPVFLSLFPLIGEALICTIGMVLVYQMWFWRKVLKARYGPLSYQRIFLVGFTGVACMISLSVNLYIQYWSFSPIFWTTSPLKFLAIPLEVYFYSGGSTIFWGRMTLSFLCLVLSIMMMIRSIQAFGIDYMAVIYLYFPEESILQDHEIYSVLRHPAYSGILLFGLGGMFSTFTLYSIIFFIIELLAFYIHIHFVEEKELIERFGLSYQEYMKKVPAFLVGFNKLRTFRDFLVGKA